jgi:hypothetical protein
MEPLQIFLCYAQSDKDGAERLKRSLALLRRQNKIKFFDQHQDVMGMRLESLHNALSISNISLLFLSNDFISDDECYEIQVQALKNFSAGQTILIPILYKECKWSDLEELFRLQPLPRDRRFINNWESEDGAFTHISEEIGKLVARLRITP